MSWAKLTITETPGVEHSVNVTVEADPPIPCLPDGTVVAELLSDVQAAAWFAAQALQEACELGGEWRTLLL